MKYQFQFGDVLQSARPGEPWDDFMTLRTQEEAKQAWDLIRLGQADGRPMNWQIVRQMVAGPVVVVDESHFGVYAVRYNSMGREMAREELTKRPGRDRTTWLAVDVARQIEHWPELDIGDRIAIVRSEK